MTVTDADAHIPSIVSTYPGADWHERETWDMFGIIFDGHPALTRILMPDDLAGSPATQGLPAGRNPGGVQGRHRAAPGHAEVLPMSTSDNERIRPTPSMPRRDDRPDDGVDDSTPVLNAVGR